MYAYIFYCRELSDGRTVNGQLLSEKFRRPEEAPNCGSCVERHGADHSLIRRHTIQISLRSCNLRSCNLRNLLRKQEAARNQVR
jgi:hypothetical protein